jgi:mannan polymerase II complex MNN10 subunit
MINAFPPGACAEAANDPRIFYNKDEHDFLVNMAGCEWGRDCWGEMYGYKLLAREMNRGFFERLWRKWTGNTSKK